MSLVSNIVNDKRIVISPDKPRAIGDVKNYFMGYEYVDHFKELTEAFQALWLTTETIANVKDHKGQVIGYSRDMHHSLFTAGVRDILKAAKLSL